MSSFFQNKHHTSWLIIIAVLFIVLFETLAQACLKQSQKDSMYFILALFLYFLICYLLYFCYANKAYLGELNILWGSLSAVSIVIAGYIFFQEEITTNHIIAGVLALGSIYFASI
jgi:multidrug transporter EmrE-like cation transporter